MPVLSVLICHLTARAAKLQELLAVLKPQCEGQPVEILVEEDQGQVTIGAKRQKLLERATGDYVAFVDDDDLVSGSYVDAILGALQAQPAATHCSLLGLLKRPGSLDEPFEHSTKYKTWEKIGPLYVRPPNHLNAIRRDLAVKIGFPALQRSEDYDFSMRLVQAGLLTGEAVITDCLYIYRCPPKPQPKPEPKVARQGSNHSYVATRTAIYKPKFRP